MPRIRLTAAEARRLLDETGPARSGARQRKPSPQPPREREADIQRAVIARLEAAGAVVVRVNGGLLPRADGGRMRCHTTRVGTCSDLLVCYRGRFVAAEIKRPGGPVTMPQRLFLDAVLAAGGLPVVLRSVTDADLLLRELGSSQ